MADYEPVFAHDGCTIEPVEPLDPSLLVDPTVLPAPAAMPDCSGGLGALPPLPPAAPPGCPVISIDPASSISIDEGSTEPTMDFSVSSGAGACSFDFLLGITIPPTGSGGGSGGSGVTVNYTGGSTINLVDASTLNVGGASTVNVDGNSTVNLASGSTINAASGSTVNLSGSLFVSGAFYSPHYSFASWSADQTDLSLTGIANFRLRVSSDQHFRVLRSIAPGATASGRVLYLHNVGDFIILIADEDAGSTAVNRIRTTTGNYYWLAPGHAVALVYDAVTERWRVSENSDERLGGVTDYDDLSADADNFEIKPQYLQHRINPTVNDVAITGIKYGQPGLKHHLINANSVNYFYLRHNDLGSDDANRLLLPGGNDIRVPPRAVVVVEYDGTAARFRAHALAADCCELENTYIGYGDAENKMGGSYDLSRPSEGQLRIELLSDDVSPGLQMNRAREDDASVETGDLCGSVWFNGYLLGDSPQAFVRCRYVGNGTSPGGQIEIGTVDDAATQTTALTIDDEARLFIATADAVEELLGTGADGEVVNYGTGGGLRIESGDLSTDLTDTFIGYGDGNDNLTGTADLARVSVGHVRQRVAASADSAVHRLDRTRDGDADAENGDTVGEWVGSATVGGVPDRWLGLMRVMFTGDVGVQTGTLHLLNVEEGSQYEGLRLVDDGDVVIANADNHNELLGTDGEGKVVNVGVGTGLSLAGGSLSVTAPATGTNTGDQNVFSTIAVSGEDSIVADSSADTMNIAAGSGIYITTDASSDTLTIACSLTEYTAEMARDDIGSALVASVGLAVTVDDGGDTIEISQVFRGARAYENVTTNLYAASTWTSIPLAAEDYDTDSMHSTSTNNSRLTIPAGLDGFWDIRGFYYPDTNMNAAGTVVQVRILLNGATVLAQSIGHIDTSGAVAVSPVFDKRLLSAGDYVELQVYHTGVNNMKGYGNDILCFLLASFAGEEP